MRYLFIVIFSIMSVGAFSQSFEKGPEIKTGSDPYFDRIIGEDKSHFYTLRFNIKFSGRFYFLEQYSKTTLKKIKAMDLGRYMLEDEVNVGQDVIRSYNRVIIFMCVLREKFYVFSKLYDDQRLKVELRADVVSLVSGEALQEEVLLSEVQSYDNDIYEKEFTITITSDSTKFLIVTHGSSQDKKQIAFADLVSTTDLARFWHKPMMSEYMASPVRSRCYQADTSGNLYYFFVYKKDRSETAFRGNAVAVIPKNPAAEIVIPLDLNKDLNLYNPSLQYLREDNSIYFTGSFRNSKTEEGKKAGMVCAKISPGSFSLSFLNAYYVSMEHQKSIECSKETPDLLKLEFCTPRLVASDNGPYIYTFINNHFMKRSGMEHYSGNIIVSRLNGHGQAQWQGMIARSSSYSYVTDNVDPTRMQTYLKNDTLFFLMADCKRGEKAGSVEVDFCKLSAVSRMSGVNLVSVGID
ncbi:MAG: hypothetical protein ACXVPQ_12670, partial [Bacteroidia bacterium]